MLAVEYIERQGQGIDTINTTEIRAIVIGETRGDMKGINTTALAKIMFRVFGPELVQPQRTVLCIYMKIIRCDWLD